MGLPSHGAAALFRRGIDIGHMVDWTRFGLAIHDRDLAHIELVHNLMHQFQWAGCASHNAGSQRRQCALSGARSDKSSPIVATVAGNRDQSPHANTAAISSKLEQVALYSGTAKKIMLSHPAPTSVERYIASYRSAKTEY